MKIKFLVWQKIYCVLPDTTLSIYPGLEPALQVCWLLSGQKTKQLVYLIISKVKAKTQIDFVLFNLQK